jgi:hypothetical protein
MENILLLTSDVVRVAPSSRNFMVQCIEVRFACTNASINQSNDPLFEMMRHFVSSMILTAGRRM